MIRNSALIGIVIFALASCGANNGGKANDEQKTQAVEETQTAQTSKPVAETGKNLYLKYCMACHQTDGSGVPGMYPPLKSSDWINGDKTKIIKQVLFGRQGPITVNGEEYNQTMPPQNYLTDEQIAAILTYLRSNLGNKASAVSADEVKNLRNSKP